ncbi:hypothetical protein [Lentzea sp. NEAU-D7]|nr:hypothetical protein [Lentzea sp. NEAU-D7]MCX2947627.1 hypothetical protein [Lentzea sp. NEAU-D7]
MELVPHRFLFVSGTMGLDPSGNPGAILATTLVSDWLVEIEVIAAA